MINKDKSISNLIERLKLIINLSLVQIVDYWEADLCAIGLKKDNKLIYISTYSYDISNIKYDYDLEIINEEEEDNINVVKEVRSVSEDELMKEIKIFLEV
jgi:hypothetical protein